MLASERMEAVKFYQELVTVILIDTQRKGVIHISVVEQYVAIVFDRRRY